MNAFYEHHKNNIRFAYRCFDRILLHAAIQPFQQEQRVVGFFDFYRQIYPVSRQLLRDIATQYHNWVKNRSQKWGVPIQQDPPGRRDDFVERYFQTAQPDQVVAIIKAREPATILTAIGKDDRWHLELKRRWVEQYNFYVQDSHWGQIFVRVCPYFPFSARVCLNQHHWLALRLQQRGIRFRQCVNAFLQCSDPEALQKLADSLTAADVISCAQKWLTHFMPFFTAEEREHAGVQHRPFFAQVEFCDNLIFRRRAAVDALEQRLLDANRTIGQPNKLTLIFGRRITRRHAGKLQTVIEDLNLPNPVIRSHYRKGFLKQYVRDRFILRTETATNNVSTDYGIRKAVENLAQLQTRLDGIIDRYLDVQQDILETLVDREQLRKLTQPTLLGGINHMTAAGRTNWFEFARAALEEASRMPRGIPWLETATRGQPLVTRRVTAIPTEEYPTPARRPAYSVLSNSRLKQDFGLELHAWPFQLRAVLSEGRTDG